jgi:DNA-binding response OmpR family regulator
MATRQGRTILVVDDDEGMREMIQDTLLREGYSVELASNCQDGMRIFRQKRIDLAIVDIYMPDQDGLETLMEMRRNSGDAKVLAISGGGKVGLGQVLTMAESLGAKSSLAKPFTPEELLRKIDEVLDSRE